HVGCCEAGSPLIRPCHPRPRPPSRWWSRRRRRRVSCSEGGFAYSEGGSAPLPTVVARLTARSSLPPPQTKNRIARAKPALDAPDHVREPALHDRRPSRLATSRTSLAAVPAARPSCGT